MDLEVKPNEFGEKGLYAARPFEQHELVLKIEGPIIAGSSAEWMEKYSRDPYKEARLIQIDDDLFVEPTGALQDYINHSCSPTCAFKVTQAPSGPMGYLAALNDIALGDPITFDYSTGMVNESWVLENCKCGTHGCRGIIREFTSLSDEVAGKYLKLGAVPQYVYRAWMNRHEK